MSYWGFKPYVSVAAKRAKAEKKIKALKKKNPNLKPVVIEGRTIAKNWWGKAWNTNLESYADYSNRIGRGRSYVRNSAVLDLQIDSGCIKSLVQGSYGSPYKIVVKIAPLDKKIWNKIKGDCDGEFDSLQKLLEGKFPESLSEIFTNKKSGLFPSPSKISFDCDCPDWASMCKHIAATLYGVGARLDSDPALFFTLRNMKIDDLISGAIKGKTTSLLKKAQQKTKRVIDDSDLSSLFGIDMEGIDTALKKTPVKRKIKKAKPLAKKVKTEKKKAVKKILKIKPTPKKKAFGISIKKGSK